MGWDVPGYPRMSQVMWDLQDLLHQGPAKVCGMECPGTSQVILGPTRPVRPGGIVRWYPLELVRTV